jgi:hypothetical protein
VLDDSTEAGVEIARDLLDRYRGEKQYHATFADRPPKVGSAKGVKRATPVPPDAEDKQRGSSG